MNFSDVFKQITLKVVDKMVLSRPNKIFLDKNGSYENMKIEFSPYLIIATNDEYIEILSKKIKQFLITMDSKCKNFDSTIFLDNIKKTFFKIENLNENFIDGKNGSVAFGKINLFSIDTFKAINHEFLHLSSFKANEESNFLILQPFIEGYTQILTDRYFNETVDESIYPLEVLFLEKIELIIGKDFMEKEYFKGKFANFINELYKYANSQTINNLISNINRVFKLEQDLEKNISEVRYLVREIYCDLFTCFKTKLKSIDNKQEAFKIFISSNWCGSIDFGNKESEIDFLDEYTYKEGMYELFNAYSK